MSKPKDGCAKPVGGILKDNQPSTALQDLPDDKMEAIRMLARVGHEAPDFEATAYFNGDFSNIKLSDYRGKWILVCFYPGDFTFV